MQFRNTIRMLYRTAAPLCAALFFFAGVCGAQEKQPPAAAVLPVEDLMREHGVLDRILLIYENCAGRLERGEELSAEVLNGAAQLVRDFIENYHERSEEDAVFPEFKKRNQLADLAETLQRQHEAGRGLTRDIIAHSSGKAVEDNVKVIADIRQFIHMYRPHKAREDTVLFPAFHALMPPAEYERLGDRFESKEKELFGEGGFGKIVEKVAALEKQLNIYDLRQFTPGKRENRETQ